MGFEDLVLLQKVLASLLVGYLLGSVPFAHLAARLRGVDIFSTGNRRAGTANVFWNVGRRTGLLVFAADVAKGSLAVMIAQLLDLWGPLVLLSGGAAVLGHWRSVFTGFKGGDGMATLVGVTLALTPLLGLLGVAAGFATVAIAWKASYRSAWGIVVCFSLIFGVGFANGQSPDLLVGLGALAILVLAHNVLIRRRLAAAGSMPRDDLDDLELDLGLDLDLGSDEGSDSDLGPTASNNR